MESLTPDAIPVRTVNPIHGAAVRATRVRSARTFTIRHDPAATLHEEGGVSMATGLVQRAQRGDHAAFDELATAAFPRLWSIARRVLRDTALAEDAVQESLLMAWRDLRALRDPDRFDAWLYRLLMHACSDQIRRSRRRPVAIAILPADRADDGDASSTVERRDLLERGFARLTPEHRMVLVLYHVMGLRAAEIADRLGIPEGTVTSRIHYGSRALRETLEADLREPLSPETRRT